MTSIPLHLDTPSQRPPATALLSAPAVDAVASDTDKDLYTDLTDATGYLKEKICVFRVPPCTKTTMPDIVIQAENLGKHLPHRPPGGEWPLCGPARRAGQQRAQTLRGDFDAMASRANEDENRLTDLVKEVVYDEYADNDALPAGA